jgi:glycosyltransferase involved in cell wall biosynthesis
MKSIQPMISILMPTLNIHQYITESVPAVLDQDVRDFELLVLDGGSSDGTLEYLEAVNDSRIRVFENCGSIVESLNQGIEESRGEYIARADGDTIPEPNWLAKCIDFLQENPEYAAVGTQAKRVLPDKSTFITDRPTTYEEITLTLLWKNPIIHPSMVIQKEPLEKVGGYRERHWEDHDLVIRLADKYKIANLSEVLVTDYVRNDGIVKSTSTTKWIASNLRCSLLALRTTDHSILEILQSAREIVLPFIYHSVRSRIQ